MFEECLKTGGYGEHAIWNLFIKSPKVKSIVDVRDDKHFQELDIDFLVENLERQFTSIEVKTDFKAHETGNIVYEISTSNNVGCFEKTQAQFIAYFIPESRQVHMISVGALRRYISQVHPKEIRMGDNATGYLLPIEDLIKSKVIKITYEGVM